MTGSGTSIRASLTAGLRCPFGGTGSCYLNPAWTSLSQVAPWHGSKATVILSSVAVNLLLCWGQPGAEVTELQEIFSPPSSASQNQQEPHERAVWAEGTWKVWLRAWGPAHQSGGSLSLELCGAMGGKQKPFGSWRLNSGSYTASALQRPSNQATSSLVLQG